VSAVLQTDVRRHRLTVDDFHRMGEAGIFRADERVELIDGEVIDMAPIGRDHARTVGFLAKRLERAVGDSALVFVQNPLWLTASSEPQPDIMLLKPRADFYRGAILARRMSCSSSRSPTPRSPTTATSRCRSKPATPSRKRGWSIWKTSASTRSPRQPTAVILKPIRWRGQARSTWLYYRGPKSMSAACFSITVGRAEA
jgi:hypothetical protein